MATQEHAASITGVAIRVTRLDGNGNLLNGPGDSYTTAGFMRLSFTPEYEEGDEIAEKGASGAVCISYKAPDTLKRLTMELAICDPDPEISNLISGGVLLRKNLGTLSDQNNKSIGWAAPAVGDDPTGNGVAIEAWSLAIKDGKNGGTLPFFYWIFPYAKLRQSGDRVIENGALATTFEGYGLGNVEFASGPDGRWEFPAVSDRPYSYARAAWSPRGFNGFYTWHGELNAAVNNKALASNVATLTTSTPHQFSAGDTVTVAGVGENFDGKFTIASVPSTTTFSYASVAEDVASAAVTPVGSAVVAPGGRAVTELEDTSDISAYNVPGNVNYKADSASDYAIQSVNNPTV